MGESPSEKPPRRSAADTGENAGAYDDDALHVRIAVGVVLTTVYVVALAVCVRVVFLTTYEELLEGLTIVSDFLLEGGTFALIVHLIRRRIPDRAVDRFAGHSYDARHR